jgi:hypothetical protein
VPVTKSKLCHSSKSISRLRSPNVRPSRNAFSSSVRESANSSIAARISSKALGPHP